MVHRRMLLFLLLFLLPGGLSAQDFPDIRIDTTARKLEFYEGRYDLYWGQGGEFWIFEANSIIRYGQWTDANRSRPGDEVGKWAVKGDSLILRIEKKNFEWRKKRLPFSKVFKMYHLQWRIFADGKYGNEGVPYVVYLTVLIDDKEINMEALTKEFIAFVRSETVDAGITLNKNTGSSTMLRMVNGLSGDFFGRRVSRRLFFGFKVYRNGELLKDF